MRKIHIEGDPGSDPKDQLFSLVETLVNIFEARTKQDEIKSKEFIITSYLKYFL